MPRESDLRQVDAICRQYRMSADRERHFRRLLHELKSLGEKGSANDRGDFTRDELDSSALEFMTGN